MRLAVPPGTGPGTGLFAFVAAVPVALALLALGALVAPQLVEAPPPGSNGLRFFEGVDLSPEPLEQARFALFLLGAPAVVATSVLLRRLVSLRRLEPLVVASVLVQTTAAGCVLWWWMRQGDEHSYFPGPVLLFAAAAAIAATAATYRLPRRRVGWAPNGTQRVAAAFTILLAGLVTTIALLPSLFHETNIGLSLPVVHFHLSFTMDEFAAVANGRTPLVDFVPQYSNLLPYLLTPVLSVVGLTVGTFTSAMFVLSAISLLSVFYVLARVTGRWVTGLMLYLPFLAISLYRPMSDGDQHGFIANYFAVMPLRYFGPWLAAGLVVWQLRHPSRRRLVGLFVVAGVVMFNNVDFGLPAFVAAVAAVRLGAGRGATSSLSRARPVLGSAATGLGAALVIVVAISLLRTGHPPDLGSSLQFARMFAISGFYMLPMPPLGLHLIIGLTFAGALVRAVFRSMSAGHQDEPARLLTGALAYGAVFGLGASAYYVGRSHPYVLVALFSAWAFVLALLAWDAWTAVRGEARATATTRVLWAVPAALLAGHLLLAVAPAWEMRDVGQQVARLTQGGQPAILEDDVLVRFLGRHAARGEKVMLLAPLSHRSALRAGVRDVFPYNSVESMVTYEQLDLVRERLRTEKVTKVISRAPVVPEMRRLLASEGFRPAGSGEDVGRPVLWRRADPSQGSAGPDG